MIWARRRKAAAGRNHRSRNPLAIFGTSRSVKIVGIMAGVAGGVTAAKLLPPMLPATWQGTAGMRFVTTAGVVIGISVAAHFALPQPYRDAVIVGAGSQLLSVALNPIVAKVTPEHHPRRYPAPHGRHGRLRADPGFQRADESVHADPGGDHGPRRDDLGRQPGQVSREVSLTGFPPAPCVRDG